MTWPTFDRTLGLHSSVSHCVLIKDPLLFSLEQDRSWPLFLFPKHLAPAFHLHDQQSQLVEGYPDSQCSITSTKACASSLPPPTWADKVGSSPFRLQRVLHFAREQSKRGGKQTDKAILILSKGSSSCSGQKCSGGCSRGARKKSAGKTSSLSADGSQENRKVEGEKENLGAVRDITKARSHLNKMFSHIFPVSSFGWDFIWQGLHGVTLSGHSTSGPR